MPIGTRIVRLFKELLPITCWRKEKNQILAKSELTVGKRGGL
jgi:hypothetical protein